MGGSSRFARSHAQVVGDVVPRCIFSVVCGELVVMGISDPNSQFFMVEGDHAEWAKVGFLEISPIRHRFGHEVLGRGFSTKVLDSRYCSVQCLIRSPSLFAAFLKSICALQVFSKGNLKNSKW